MSTTTMGKVVAAATIYLLSHTDQEDFSRRSRRSPPLNASRRWEAKARHPQRSNTGGSRGSQQAPYLFRSSGPQVLQSLDLWRNLHLQAASCMVVTPALKRGPFFLNAGLNRGRDGPPNSVAGSKQATHHPTHTEQPSCGISKKFCDRRANVMAQHKSITLPLQMLHQHSRPWLISCDNVQSRRDFLLTP